MAEFTKVASISELPAGKMKEYQVGGKTIVIANTDGEYFAFDASCTHEHCSLAGGFLDGHTVTCYCHGAQFDTSTGEVLAPPANTPLHIYKIKVESDEIWVEV